MEGRPLPASHPAGSHRSRRTRVWPFFYAVYLSSKRGIHRFQIFVKTNEALDLIGDITQLKAGELAALKASYRQAVAEMKAAAAHGKALGMSDSEVGAFMKLRARRKAMDSAELRKEMDAWKVKKDSGHSFGLKSAERATEPGAWVEEKGILDDARIYQAQITRHEPGYAYRVLDESAPTGRVLFDGFDGKVLQECKGPGYDQFLDPKRPGRFMWWFERTQVKVSGGMVDQARRQLTAAKGTPVRWYVAERDSADAIRKLLKEHDLEQIEVVHVPMQR